MKISIDWLKQYIDIQESTETIADLLTASGLEVEGLERVERVKGGLEGVVIAEVLTCEKHPNADKLNKTTVDVGNGEAVPIVCGAPNVATGQKVVVATVGSTLYPKGEDDGFKIKKAKIRGEVSQGMICAEDEIGLGESHAGIMVLDTQVPNGTPAAEFFNLQAEEVLEIGLTPNRADAASHLGTARDLQALLGNKVKTPSVEAFKVDKADNPLEVIVENHEACPRYSGLCIDKVKVEASPEWLQQRLLSIGLQPINNVVDITNYVMHSIGQPMHAFDRQKIKGDKVVIRPAVNGEQFVTLDEKKHTLTDQDLMICNAEEGMCIAGVFGGLKSGVSEHTTKIFLESAYFSPDWVRGTSQRHTIKTDSSFRYERGTDPNITVYALKYAALLIKEIAGGVITSDIYDLYPQEIKNFEVPVKYKHINRLIGIDISPEKVQEILNGLEIVVLNPTEEGFTASVPPYRVDVTREADVIEEILRIYGYDNIPVSENLNSDYLADFPVIDGDKLKLDLSKNLAANGFQEIITNSLTKPAYAEKTEGLEPVENVEMLNKLSEELGVMRQELLFSGLEVIAYNNNRKQSDLKFFEFGKQYFKKGKKYEEQNRLGIFLTGNVEAENWMNKPKKVDFYNISHVINKILTKFNVSNHESEVVHNGLFAYGLSIQVNGKNLLTAGKVNPKVCKLAQVRQEVFYANIDWDYLLSLKNDVIDYEAVSKYPEVRRDLSLVIDQKVSYQEIKSIAQRKQFRLIQRLNAFDVYEGDKLEAGKKAYAISFILQDKNKTLTDKVIDKVMSQLMKAYEQELGAVIRK